jgi:hypothetical protein
MFRPVFGWSPTLLRRRCWRGGFRLGGKRGWAREDPKCADRAPRRYKWSCLNLATFGGQWRERTRGGPVGTCAALLSGPSGSSASQRPPRDSGPPTGPPTIEGGAGVGNPRTLRGASGWLLCLWVVVCRSKTAQFQSVAAWLTLWELRPIRSPLISAWRTSSSSTPKL